MIIFGIDAGSKSVGWSVIDTTKQAIIAAGSHIFSNARSAKTNETLASARRLARLQRRQGARRKSRLKSVARLIRSHIDPDFDPRARIRIAGQVVRPDEARARLLTDGPEDFGGDTNYRKAAAIALYNLAGFRGFQSNLAAPPDYGLRAETRGEEMYRLRSEGKPSRLSAEGVKVASDPRTKRIHIKEEFELICDATKYYLPDLQHARNSFWDAMFFQRPLKDGNRGRCAYMKNEVRAWTHEHAYQAFAIRKSLSDIRCSDDNGEIKFLCEHPDLMDEVFESAWKDGITWKGIERKVKSEFGKQAMLINVAGQESEGRKKIGPAQVDEAEDEEGNSTKRTGNVSVLAARLIHDRMLRDRCGEYEAVESLSRERSDFDATPNVQDIPAGREMLSIDALEDIVGEINDHSVRVPYGQIRRTISILIKRFGMPDEVALESAKEIGRGKAALDKAAREQAQRIKNREANESRGSKSIFARLVELHGDDCLYCGERKADDRDHVIPFALNGTNAFYNQVPSCRGCNHSKGPQTPFQAFFGTPQWGYITKRLEALKKSNRKAYNAIHWRFSEDVLETMEAGFHPRDLHSLRYAEKLIRCGIAPITKRPKIVRGASTAKGRRHFRLTKDRGDHRHHAQDAIVVALSPRNALRGEFPMWVTTEDINRAVENAVVTHRADHSRQGKLHNDKPVKWSEQRPTHIEVGEGNHRKVFAPNGNWAFEIYRTPDAKIVGKTITRFAANQKGFRPGVSARPHPCAKLVRRLFVNDVIVFEGHRMRVKKINQAGNIELIDANDARPTSESPKVISASAGRLFSTP